MKLLKRTGYYLIGVSLGTILVVIIWKGKNVSFNYGMDARTLSSIRSKQLIYSDEAKNSMKTYAIDTSTIKSILVSADVDFSKSKQRKKPCAEYYISGVKSTQNIHLYIQRCDSTATILNIWNYN